MAYRLAEEVQPAAGQFFSQNPRGELSISALKDQGIDTSGEVKLEVPTYNTKQSDWKVDVWHPGGNKLYQVTAQGVETTNQ